jgi:UDP-N-acetylglucosamine--N-acetylmuramyl-(pentapeptide) pyrophosphoryl-undecaprenol N-acetylglucosamine transferase
MEYGFTALTELAGKLDPELSQRYRILPYVGKEIVDVLSVADAVLSRSGAAIVNEITRLGLPSILVPYPQSIGDEQRHLAKVLEAAGAAIVLDQSALTKQVLLNTLQQLGPAEREAMRLRVRSLARENVEEELAGAILGMIGAGEAETAHRATA